MPFCVPMTGLIAGIEADADRHLAAGHAERVADGEQRRRCWWRRRWSPWAMRRAATCASACACGCASASATIVGVSVIVDVLVGCGRPSPCAYWSRVGELPIVTVGVTLGVSDGVGVSVGVRVSVGVGVGGSTSTTWMAPFWRAEGTGRPASSSHDHAERGQRVGADRGGRIDRVACRCTACRPAAARRRSRCRMARTRVQACSAPIRQVNEAVVKPICGLAVQSGGAVGRNAAQRRERVGLDVVADEERALRAGVEDDRRPRRRCRPERRPVSTESRRGDGRRRLRWRAGRSAPSRARAGASDARRSAARRIDQCDALDVRLAPRRPPLCPALAQEGADAFDRLARLGQNEGEGMPDVDHVVPDVERDVDVRRAGALGEARRRRRAASRRCRRGRAAAAARADRRTAAKRAASSGRRRRGTRRPCAAGCRAAPSDRPPPCSASTRRSWSDRATARGRRRRPAAASPRVAQRQQRGRGQAAAGGIAGDGAVRRPHAAARSDSVGARRILDGGRKRMLGTRGGSRSAGRARRRPARRSPASCRCVLIDPMQ